MTLTHGSLFAGIGGFDLGFERAGIKTIWQVEIDKYCQRVLAKHFPGANRFEDIRNCCGHRSCDEDFCGKGFTLPWVDIISGGFHCQDISHAGKQAGIDGERSGGTWREMYRVILEMGPRVVVVENVAALLGRGMGRVLGDLAAAGFDCEWDCLPLGAFGAHFLRDRVFIIASRSLSSSVRPQGSRPRPIGAWSEQQFEGLLRDQLQLALPAGRFGRVSVGVPSRMDRLWGLGDAVSPAQTEWIGRRIVDCAAREKS